LLVSVAFLSLAFTFFAAWARITHQPYAAKALRIGMNTQYLGLAALAIYFFCGLPTKKINLHLYSVHENFFIFSIF
jgi:hypothetical protein